MEFGIEFSGYFTIKAENKKEAECIALDVLSDFADLTDNIKICNYIIEKIIGDD